MPELPEVETVTKGLNLSIKNFFINDVFVFRKDFRIRISEDFIKLSKGTKILKVQRRAKYGKIYLDNNYVIVFHLGMSGRIIISKHEAFEKKKHDHVVFYIKAEKKSKQIIYVKFNDPRRFGFINIYKYNETNYRNLFKNLGPEPLSKDLNVKNMIQTFKYKSSSIKSVLLDQKVIAGLGNIYVCEALFTSSILPQKQACKLSVKEITLLIGRIKSTLLEAIKVGGATIQDHRNINGEIGYFQKNFLVYDKEGKECKNKFCKEKIKRIVQNGRSTFYCTNCQK